jgi:hypothetical protein
MVTFDVVDSVKNKGHEVSNRTIDDIVSDPQRGEHITLLVRTETDRASEEAKELITDYSGLVSDDLGYNYFRATVPELAVGTLRSADVIASLQVEGEFELADEGN